MGSSHYPKLDRTPTTNAGAVTINDVPSYEQDDPRWANEPYKLNPQLGSFGKNGCTVTAAAIVAQWASGRVFTPSMANADWAGTLRQFKYEDLSGRGVAFGNTFPAVSRDSAHDLLGKIKAAVKSGHPVVLGISGGVITPDGQSWSRHTVVVSGITKDGELLVNDPATGRQHVSLSEFKFKNFDMAFAISKRDGSGGTVSQINPPKIHKPSTSIEAPTAWLERGSRGAQVEMLQRALVKLGYMTQEEMNTGPGIFGPRTERALRACQRDHGLVADGIYGPKTQAALRRALEEAQSAPPNTAVGRLPKTIEEANRFFKTQFRSKWNTDGPSGSVDCGPASLEMALEAIGLRPASHTLSC